MGEQEPQWVEGLYKKLDEHQNDFRDTIRLELAPVVQRLSVAEKDLCCLKSDVQQHDEFIKAQQSIGGAVWKGGAIVGGTAAFAKIIYDWLHK